MYLTVVICSIEKLAKNMFFDRKFAILKVYAKVYFDKSAIFCCDGQNNNYFCNIIIALQT